MWPSQNTELQLPSAPQLRSHYSRYTHKCGARIHVTLDDIIMESEDEIEHSHMPNPTEDKINKVGKCANHVIFEVMKLSSNVEIVVEF